MIGPNRRTSIGPYDVMVQRCPRFSLSDAQTGGYYHEHHLRALASNEAVKPARTTIAGSRVHNKAFFERETEVGPSERT